MEELILPKIDQKYEDKDRQVLFMTKFEISIQKILKRTKK